MSHIKLLLSLVVLGLAAVGFVVAGSGSVGALLSGAEASGHVSPVHVNSLPQGKTIGFDEFLALLIKRDPSLSEKIEKAKRGEGDPFTLDKALGASLGQYTFLAWIEHPNQNTALGQELRAAITAAGSPTYRRETLTFPNGGDELRRAGAQAILETVPGAVLLLPRDPHRFTGGFSSAAHASSGQIIALLPAGKEHFINDLQNRSIFPGRSSSGPSFFFTVPADSVGKGEVRVPYFFHAAPPAKEGVVNLANVIFGGGIFNDTQIQYDMYGSLGAGDGSVPDPGGDQGGDGSGDGGDDDGDDNGGGNGGNNQGGNQAPIARMTIDPERARVGETIRFDGSASTDPDGDEIMIYSWMFYRYDATGGRNWAAQGKDGKVIEKSFLAPGRYEAVLFVKDIHDTPSRLAQEEFVITDATGVDPDDPGDDVGDGSTTCKPSKRTITTTESLFVTTGHGPGPFRWTIQDGEPNLRAAQLSESISRDS